MSQRLAFALALLLSLAAHAADTGAVFHSFRDRVVQIRVIEQRSGTKSALGSGWFAGPDGELITNYHVIADLALHPDDYRVEAVGTDAQPRPAKVVAVDVVHDLAGLVVAGAHTPFLPIAKELPAQGTRLFAFGNPLDLGEAIVEGTLNGPVQYALRDQLHFTGAINSGMSGGPAVTAEGEVVGVNDATGGNGLGFLVPSSHATELLARMRAPARATLLDQVRDELLEHQQTVTQDLLATPLPPTRLAGHQVPGPWKDFLHCWGDSSQQTSYPYRITRYLCRTEDDLFLSEHQRSGSIHYTHEAISSTELGRLRFAALFDSRFDGSYDPIDASEEDVTNFRCHTRYVDLHRTHLQVAFCARAYRKLSGLYDAVLQVATLEPGHEGVQSSLVLGGFSFENARAIAARYLEAFAWEP